MIRVRDIRVGVIGVRDIMRVKLRTSPKGVKTRLKDNRVRVRG